MPTQNIDKKSKRKVILFFVIGLLVILPIALTVSVIGAASYFRGTGTPMAVLSESIPTENIPAINKLGKSNNVLVQDAMKSEMGNMMVNTLGMSGDDLNFIEVIDQRHMKTNIGFDVEFEDLQNNSKGIVDVNLLSESKYDVGDNQNIQNTNMILTGDIKYSVVNISLEEGVSVDMIVNEDKMYLKVDIPEELMELINSQSNDREMNELLNDFLGNYWSLHLDEEMQNGIRGNPLEMMFGQGNVRDDEVNDAINKLMDEAGDDINDLIVSTVGDFESYAEVNYIGRENINNKTTSKYELKINEEEVPQVFGDLLRGMPDLALDNKEAFEEFCKSMELTGRSGDCEINEDNLREDYSEDEISRMEDDIEEILQDINLDNFYLYVSPKDNTLVKYELDVVVEDQTLEEMAVGQEMEFNKFIVSVSNEEVSRNEDVNIEIPDNAGDLEEFLENDVQGYYEEKNKSYYDDQERLRNEELLNEYKQEFNSELNYDTELNFEDGNI